MKPVQIRAEAFADTSGLICCGFGVAKIISKEPLRLVHELLREALKASTEHSISLTYSAQTWRTEKSGHIASIITPRTIKN